MKYELKHTADGSFTIYIPEMQEQYHSMNGAVTESEHVFIKMGFEKHPSSSPVVFEVGFGTGLNALLTAAKAEIQMRPVTYIAIEKYPVETGLLNQLNYGKFIPKTGDAIFSTLHQCEWNKPQQITPYFNLLKVKDDLINFKRLNEFQPDIVFFDAFGPDKQPEMWEQQVFSDIYRSIRDGGILVTYSAKGEVRRRLLTAGFLVEKLPGPPGKKEMLRAIK